MNGEVKKEIIEIYLEDILPNRFQPRLTFDQKSLNELAESIKQHGIIQPLVVRKLGDKYEIIAGERRYKAAQITGLKTVPCIVMNLDDNTSAEIAVVENIQRKEMTPLEEARSYKKILDKGYLTQDQLAIRMGKSQSSIANKLRLLNLDESVQDALLNEKISERHARSLLAVKDNMKQKEILNNIIEKKLTVKQTDDLIKEIQGTTDEAGEEGNPETKEEGVAEFNNSQAHIPNPYNDLSINPQVAIMNRLNTSETKLTGISELPRQEDSFGISPMPYIDEESLSTNENVEIKEEPPVFDQEESIEKIKEESKSIIEPQAAPANINDLLKGTEEEKPQEEPKNRFIFNLEEEPEVLDLGDSFGEKEKQPESLKKGELNKAIELLKNDVETLKQSDLIVDLEEFDFENLYQMIIKIQK